ncbi:MAG: hypothetical protein P8165_09165 [Deltaproteobacteria bacterium]
MSHVIDLDRERRLIRVKRAFRNWAARFKEDFGPETHLGDISLDTLCVRFECMKRLGWLERYPGEEYALVSLVTQFDRLAPGLQANIPHLRKDHPEYPKFAVISTYDKEGFVRKLIPKLMRALDDYGKTL